MAQSVARQAVNLQVAGSNPAGGDFCCWGNTQTAGFEPAHAEHTRLAGEPRNHLGTSAAAAAARQQRRPRGRSWVVRTPRCDRGNPGSILGDRPGSTLQT